MEKLHYICGRKVNRPVTYRNNIYGTLRNEILVMKPPVLIPILSNKNRNVKIDDFIHGNDISMYDQAHGVNGELKKLSIIITTYLQTEIIVSIRKMIPK